MAWYLIKKRKGESGKGDKALYVAGRTTVRGGYIYNVTPAIKKAKVFHSEATANEWCADMDEGGMVMSEISQQKFAESRRLRTGKSRGEYIMKPKNK
jgi:hypothetical protein